MKKRPIIRRKNGGGNSTEIDLATNDQTSCKPVIAEGHGGSDSQKESHSCTGKSPGASEILELLSGDDFDFFTDQNGKPFTRFYTGKHFEIQPLDSSAFHMFLKKRAFEVFGKTVKDQAIKEVFGVLNGEAVYEGSKYDLDIRSVRNGIDLWLDLGTPDRVAVKINAEGWEVIKSTEVPILFKRQNHMKPLPVPKKSVALDSLKNLLHIRDENAWILLKVWLVTAFIPDIPRPCLVFHGLQGAGKSFAGRLLKCLIDPSMLDLLPTPTNHQEFIQQISNNYLLVLDNLNDLKPWMSDSLCRATTGGAFSKRKHYSNDEDVIFQFKRLFIINGINNPAAASDLLDRSILVELDRIPPEQRKTETDILSDFETIAPNILGNILDVLSEALKIQDNFEYTDLPRMADWARIGCAVAEVMGIGRDEFLLAYQRNIHLQHVEISENDIVANAVTLLANQAGSVTETPGQIHKMCKELLPEEATKSRAWPKSPALFSKRLKLVSNNLREIGIVVEFIRGKQRLISITRK